MKESITKFDLEAAFKALDEIDIPQVKGLRPNKMNLSEATNRVDRTSMLIEDYYNLNSQEDLQEATEDREAEVAKAKLARIEKIVDLNAETEDDILPSYIGKIIIQCPECMTLFYKDEADIQKSDEDPTTVNVGEVCQHCGNDAGYMLIGKVAEETPEDLSAETTEEETVETEELPELSDEESTENTEEENNSEEENTEELPDLEELPLPEEESEEEEKNESLNNSKLLKDIKKNNELASENTSENTTLNESIDDENLIFNRPLVVDTINCNKIMVELEDKDLAKKVDELASAAYAKSDKYSGWEYFDRFANKYGLKFEVIFDDDDNFNESIKKTQLQEITSTYDFIIYAVDKNGDTVIEKDFHGRVKDAKAEMQAILDNDSEENITDVFISRKEGHKEIPIDRLTLSRYDSFDDDAFDAKHNLASESLKEDLDTDMSKYNTYIDYIQAQIKADEEELKKAGDNQLIKDAIQKKLDAHKADLENALPPVVKDAQAEDELPTPEEAKVDEKPEEESEEKNESLNKSKVLKDIAKKNELMSENTSENTTLNEEACKNCEKETEAKVCEKCGKEICECDKALTEDEDISLTYSDEAIEDMFNSKEFKTPISDEEVEDYIEDDKAAEELKNVEDIQEASFNKHISDYLTEVYSNVNKFEMTNCQLDSSKLVIEGIINFKSGNTKETSFTFRPRANKILEGYNKDITESTNAFKISYSNEDVEGCGNTLITESIEYNYSADNTVVKGKK